MSQKKEYLPGISFEQWEEIEKFVLAPPNPDHIQQITEKRKQDLEFDKLCKHIHQNIDNWF